PARRRRRPGAPSASPPPSPTRRSPASCARGASRGAPISCRSWGRASGSARVAVSAPPPDDLMPLLVATERELAPWLASVPPHEDDLPAVEYESGVLLLREPPCLQALPRPPSV